MEDQRLVALLQPLQNKKSLSLDLKVPTLPPDQIRSHWYVP